MHSRSRAAALLVPADQTSAVLPGRSKPGRFSRLKKRASEIGNAGVWFKRAGLALIVITQTGTAQAATIAFPDPFDGIAGAFALRFDIAGATPPGEVISEARFTATFRALPTPSPAPLLDVTEIPRRLVERREVGDGAYTTYRTETVRRFGVSLSDVAFAVGDLQQADREGRLGRITLPTTPVATSDSYSGYYAYNLVNPDADLGNCKEDNPSWVDFILKGPPDDCFATYIDIYETVLTTVTETPNTRGVLIDFALTEPEIAFAALNGFIEVSFKGNGNGEIYAPSLAFKSVPRAIDPDDGVTPVPVPPSAGLLAAALALLALQRRAPASRGQKERNPISALPRSGRG